MPTPVVGEIYTTAEGREYHEREKPLFRLGYQVRSVNTGKNSVELVGIGTSTIFTTNYNKHTGDIFGYERVIPTGEPVRIGGKKKSRTKSRKNKRKTMRRNKFMKWF